MPLVCFCTHLMLVDKFHQFYLVLYASVYVSVHLQCGGAYSFFPTVRFPGSIQILVSCTSHCTSHLKDYAGAFTYAFFFLYIITLIFFFVVLTNSWKSIALSVCVIVWNFDPSCLLLLATRKVQNGNIGECFTRNALPEEKVQRSTCLC